MVLATFSLEVIIIVFIGCALEQFSYFVCSLKFYIKADLRLFICGCRVSHSLLIRSDLLQWGCGVQHYSYVIIRTHTELLPHSRHHGVRPHEDPCRADAQGDGIPGGGSLL